jgi:integrase
LREDAFKQGEELIPGELHTCVSLLLDLGVPPHIVRDIVGHSDIEVTMTIYAHAALDEKRKALKKLGDALG